MASDFGAKIGPLPAYAWGGIIGTVAVGIAYWRSSTTKAARAVPAAAVSAINPLDGAFTPGTARGSGGGVGIGVVNPSGSMDTNATWLTSAVQFLSGKGISPLAAVTALQKYLHGDPLTYAEGQSVDLALGSKGLPPNGADTPVVGPKVVDPIQHTMFSSFIKDESNGRIYGVNAATKAWELLDPGTYAQLGNPATLSVPNVNNPNAAAPTGFVPGVISPGGITYGSTASGTTSPVNH